MGDKKQNLARLASLFRTFTGNSIEMNTFDNRIKFQKLIYILESIGINFDYSFSWYVRGPYSSSLASDGFEVSTGHIKDDEYHPIPDEISKITGLKDAIPGIDNSETAELYGSIIFLMREKNLSGQELIEKIKSLKPWYTEEKIKEAVNKIVSSGMF